MTKPSQEIVTAVATPSGRGAVATVIVDGPAAISLVENHIVAVGRPLSRRAVGDIAYGRWQSATGEDVVVTCKSPSIVEIHCHGGPAASMAIQGALARAGCRTISWQELTSKRACDSIESAARIALSSASTHRTAAILLDQAAGALRNELLQMAENLETGNTAAAIDRLAMLRRRSIVGLHLATPWRVTFAGPANVGKSSLINRVLGFERSIVFDKPGTTRDVVKAQTAVDGWAVELADTAGLRLSSDELEAAGVERAKQQLEQSDLAVLVFDASHAWTESDAKLLRAFPYALVVHNKADLQVDLDRRPVGVHTSATTGAGLDDLLAEIVGRLVSEPIKPGSAVPFTSEQATAINRALELTRSGNLANAALELKRCLGTI